MALQLLSGVCYAFHAAMAIKVFRFHKARNQQIEEGTLVEEIDFGGEGEEGARSKRKVAEDC